MNLFYKASLLALVATLTSNAAHAQASFRPGYIVRSVGDTLRGEVQAVGALRNALVCRFRPAPGGVVTEYAPASLRAYGILHEAMYETQRVPPADSTQTPAPQPFFVEVLVTGRARLYSLRDRDRHNHYFVAVGAPDVPLQELVERRIKTFSNGFEAYETQARYRTTLAAVLRDCPSVQVQLPALPFLQAALIRVVMQYNECVGGAVAVKAAPARHHEKPVLSLLGGYQHGSMSFSGSAFFSSSLTIPQASLTGGLGLSFTLPQTRRTVSLQLEALYAHELYESSYQSMPATAGSAYLRTTTYKFDLSYVHVPVLLRYTLMRSQLFRPFLEAGGIYSRVVRSQTLFTMYDGSTNTTAIIPLFPGSEVENNQFGLVGGIGASVPVLGTRRLGLLLRASTSTGPSNYTDLSTPIIYYSVLLSLDLTKP